MTEEQEKIQTIIPLSRKKRATRATRDKAMDKDEEKHYLELLKIFGIQEQVIEEKDRLFL